MSNNGYVVGAVKRDGQWRHTNLHRYIMDPPDGMVVDHINGDKLDNRRQNLRVCTATQNYWNAGVGKRNKSGYKGVYYWKERNKYRAYIMANGSFMNLGSYNTAEEAARAYDAAAAEHFGEFARFNLRQCETFVQKPESRD